LLTWSLYISEKEKKNFKEINMRLNYYPTGAIRNKRIFFVYKKKYELLQALQVQTRISN